MRGHALGSALAETGDRLRNRHGTGTEPVRNRYGNGTVPVRDPGFSCLETGQSAILHRESRFTTPVTLAPEQQARGAKKSTGGMRAARGEAESFRTPRSEPRIGRVAPKRRASFSLTTS